MLRTTQTPGLHYVVRILCVERWLVDSRRRRRRRRIQLYGERRRQQMQKRTDLDEIRCQNRTVLFGRIRCSKTLDFLRDGRFVQCALCIGLLTGEDEIVDSLAVQRILIEGCKHRCETDLIEHRSNHNQFAYYTTKSSEYGFASTSLLGCRFARIALRTDCSQKSSGNILQTKSSKERRTQTEMIRTKK